MPDDNNGNYSLPGGYKAVTGQKVLASQHNPPLEDLSACMTARLPRNGSAPMLANLPMGGFRVNGLGNAVDPTDAMAFGQAGDAFASQTASAASKATPVDADLLPLADSAASFVLKSLSWANIKATLKTYFDTLYPSIAATLLKAGGTMMGDLTLKGNPTTNLMAATKQYVDAAVIPGSMGTKYTDVSASRVRTTVYTNSTGRWLFAFIGSSNNGNSVELSPDGVTWYTAVNGAGTYAAFVAVPPTWRYRANPSVGTLIWLETVD